MADNDEDDRSDSTVIVALPAEDDPVYRISSEDVPHMTLLFLGDKSGDADFVQHVFDFISHVSDVMLTRFGLDVDRRGTLGPEDADVLFFNQQTYDIRPVTAARNALLADSQIKAAFDANDQFPEWQPHLTLGYPDAPAKDDEKLLPIYWVKFDRLALWTGNSEGPEFLLKAPGSQYPELAQSDETRSFAGVELAHHGVKGMRWGVRTSRGGYERVGSGTAGNFKEKASDHIHSTKSKIDKEVKERTGKDVVVRQKPGNYINTVGGNKHEAHEDAVNARTSKQIAKKSTTDALSNKELQNLVTRMNLEQQYKNLSEQEDRRSEGEKQIHAFLNDHGDKVPAASPVSKGALSAARYVLGQRAPKKKGDQKSKKNK